MNETEKLWRERRFVRWMCSQWCNFACSYCHQDHKRRSYYRGSPAHWADNRPWVDWWNAFHKHFPGPTTFHITGGEPFVDAKDFRDLLRAMLEHEAWFVEVDTNASWDPAKFGAFNERVELHASWHPEEVYFEEFFLNLRSLRAAGWTVRTAVIVDSPANRERVPEFVRECVLMGVAPNVMPLDWKPGSSEYLPSIDQEARHGTHGRPCLFPRIAYEIDPDGSLTVACHRHMPELRGSLWDKVLPPLPTSATCPRGSCSCEEKYPWQEHLNLGLRNWPSPKRAFAERVLEHLRCRDVEI